MNGNTVLVTDGRQVFALLHVTDTVFTLGDYGVEWESLAVDLAHAGGAPTAASSVDFLAQDPRIVVMPLNPATRNSAWATVVRSRSSARVKCGRLLNRP